MDTTVKRLLAAALLIAGTCASAGSNELSARETAIVSAYLYNFGKFVGWPESAFDSATAAMFVCVYGDDYLGASVDALNAKRASGHLIEVQRLDRGASVNQCHILFLSRSERLYLRPLLALTRAAPILTVSDIPDFVDFGGMIGLLPMDRKLRFEINKKAAQLAGLRVSSQLLALATRIVDQANAP